MRLGGLRVVRRVDAQHVHRAVRRGASGSSPRPARTTGSRRPWPSDVSWATTVSACAAGALRRRSGVVLLLGKAAVSRCRVCISGMDAAATRRCPTSASGPAPVRRGHRAPSTETTNVRPGRWRAGRSIAGQRRGSRVWVASRHRNGTRGRSMPRPSLTSTAGSTVNEPSTATATTMIEPAAREANTASRAMNRPSIETITAAPETSTECPEVSAAISIASRCVRPRAAPRAPLDVEQGVVDAHRHAHQQDHARRDPESGITCETSADQPGGGGRRPRGRAAPARRPRGSRRTR